MNKEALSVAEFCATHGIARGTFYKLRKCGLAPRAMKVGRRTLITTEAAEEWRRRMEVAHGGGERGQGSGMSGNHASTICLNITRLQDDLTSRIMDGIKNKFATYPHQPSDQHLDGLEQIAIAIQMMADGNAKLPKKFLLSSLPTGMGKTTTVVEAVKAILADPAYRHVGIVVFLSQLDQIPRLIDAMELKPEQFRASAA